MNPESGAAVQYDTCFPQDGEMTRDLRLGEGKCFGQITNAELFVGLKKHQSPQTRGIGQGARKLFWRGCHNGDLAASADQTYPFDHGLVTGIETIRMSGSRLLVSRADPRRETIFD